MCSNLLPPTMSLKNCRICYKQDQDDLISVRLMQDSITIEQMIRIITSITVSSDCRLPQNICLQCLDRLKAAYDLRQQCIQTNDRLCAELECNRDLTERHVVHKEQIIPQSNTALDGEHSEEIDPTTVVSKMIDEDVLLEVNDGLDQVEHTMTEHYAAIDVINFACCGCAMDFSSRDELEEHAVQQHRIGIQYPEGSSFICPTCYQTFPDQSMLNLHYEKRNVIQQENASVHEASAPADLTAEPMEREDYLLGKQHEEEAVVDSLKQKPYEIAIDFDPKEPNDEFIKNEEYLLEDSNGLDEGELSLDVEFSDAEEVTDDDIDNLDEALEETTTIESTERIQKASIQRAMCRIAVENLLVVSQEQGYMIVEMHKHRCCCCGELFSTELLLNEHLEERVRNVTNVRHGLQEKYACEYCGKQFTHWLVYVCHKRMREQRQFYMCTLCNAVLDSKKRMIAHMLLSDEHANYFNLCRESIADRFEAIELPGTRCCCCKKYFDDKAEQMEHIRRVHGLPLARQGSPDEPTKHAYCCDVCGRRFRNERHVEHHLQYTVDTTQYYCNLCDFQTYNPRLMELHFYCGTHPDTLPASVQLKPLLNDVTRTSHLMYWCCFDGCHKQFQDEAALKLHIYKAHQKVYKANRTQSKKLNRILRSYYECNVCSVLFKSLGALQAHQAPRAHQKKFVCAFCGVTKRTGTSLRVHEQSHTGERPFQCECCDKTFITKRALVSHRGCHITGQHTCDLCGRVFNRKENLTRHITLKHGEATIQCDVCPKKFKSITVLNIHKLSHTGEKRFKCRTESCDKRYTTVADRRRHEMSVHTLERPHKCSYCNAAFIRKRQLTIHERRHTGDKPFVCPICGKDFVDGYPLRNHMRNVCKQALIE